LKNSSSGLGSGNEKEIPLVQKNQDIPCSGEVMHSDAVDIESKTKSENQRNTKGSSLMNLLNKEDSSMKSPDMKILGVPSSVKLDHGSSTDECEKTERKESWEKTCDESGKSLNSYSKNSSSAGPLRYALHLRFICPSPKKTSKSVKKCSFSFQEKAGLDIEGERRFYLCNDLKVVFPQRHSDADEGKVCICLYGGFTKLLHIFLCHAKAIKSNIASLFGCGKLLIYFFLLSYGLFFSLSLTFSP
jgi:hypothetical protein